MRLVTCYGTESDSGSLIETVCSSRLVSRAPGHNNLMCPLHTRASYHIYCLHNSGAPTARIKGEKNG